VLARSATVEEPIVDERRLQASEWRLGVGHALDMLRSDVTEFFNGDDPDQDYSIFSEDIILEDAHLPGVKIQGLQAYRKAMDALRWSVRTACDRQHMEITAMSPPVNGIAYMRWRLKLWPKDPWRPAKDFLTPALSWNSPLLHGGASAREPIILEGYSKYEFDPWSAKIIRHSIDITNPPMPLADVMQRLVQFPLFELSPIGVRAVPFDDASGSLTTR